MDKLILRILLRFIRIFIKKDVDFERLKIIAETKVLMDRRRTPSNFKQKQRKEMKNPLLFTLIMYSFIGLFVAAIILNGIPLPVSMIIVHSYLLFMMAMTLVTDFSSVLLDTTDNQIILPKPVNSRTLFLARVVHILVYLLQFTIALMICPVAATFLQYGLLTGTVTLITLPFTVAFAVFLTYLLYALILRFANEQKIKDIISYFQIFMTVFFAAGFQIFPRMIDLKAISFQFKLHWYSYLLEPVWMSVTTEAFHDLNFNSVHLIMIACAFVVPVLLIFFMIRFLAPSFSKKLGALNNSSEADKGSFTAVTKQKKDLAERFSSMACGTQTERVGFEKTWKVTARDKNFKIQFYPSLAYLLVLVFVFVFKNPQSFIETWNGLSSTKSFLAFVYLPIFSISACLSIVPFNDNFTAAWIYQSAPITDPGQVISGMLKALLIKFFIPVYVIFFGFALYIWGVPVADDFIFGFFNNILIFLLMANFSDHYFPFSQQPNIKMQTGKFVRMIIQLVIVGILIGAHYAALFISWLPAALIPFSAAGCYFLQRRIQRLPWLKISI